jgi:hypothetical protein
MTAITWQTVDSLGDQIGTCAEGRFLIRSPDSGGRVRVHFRPNLPAGTMDREVYAAIDALTAWSPESNRLVAMHPLMDGSEIGYFHDRDAARLHLERILIAPVPEALLEQQFATAGFVACPHVSGLYQRKLGTSTFEVSVRDTGVSLRVFKSPTRWRMLADLHLPSDQGHPIRTVGVWPAERGDLRAFAAAVIAIADWAAERGLVSAVPRPARRKAA